jgi:hypothetical protein
MATTDDSDWLIFLDSSPRKPFCQMIRNLAGSNHGTSFVAIAYFVPIRLQTWPPQAILVSDWPIFKSLLL